MFDDAVKIIEKFEGCRLDPYQCPSCHWTIGYGSTFLANGQPVRSTTSPISQEQADKLLAATVNHIGGELEMFFKGIPVQPYQMDAMISLAYNIGLSAFKSSTLAHLVLNRNFNRAADEFLKWDKISIDGRLVPYSGLLKRREAERRLFIHKPSKSFIEWLSGFVKSQKTLSGEKKMNDVATQPTQQITANDLVSNLGQVIENILGARLDPSDKHIFNVAMSVLSLVVGAGEESIAAKINIAGLNASVLEILQGIQQTEKGTEGIVDIVKAHENAHKVEAQHTGAAS